MTGVVHLWRSVEIFDDTLVAVGERETTCLDVVLRPVDLDAAETAPVVGPSTTGVYYSHQSPFNTKPRG